MWGEQCDKEGQEGHFIQTRVQKRLLDQRKSRSQPGKVRVGSVLNRGSGEC